MCCSCLLIKGIFTFPTPPPRIWSIQRPRLLCFYPAHASTVSNPSLLIFIFYFYNYGQALIELYYMLLCFSTALSFWIFLSRLLFVGHFIRNIMSIYPTFYNYFVCFFSPFFTALFSALILPSNQVCCRYSFTLLFIL